MAKHRAENESSLAGTVATRGLLTAVAALAVAGGPAAGMALANGTDGADAHKTSYNGTPGADGKDGAHGHAGKDGRDGKDGEDGTDGKDGQRGADGTDGGKSAVGETANGENGTPGTDFSNGGLALTPPEAPTLGGYGNPFTGVLGNDVGL